MAGSTFRVDLDLSHLGGLADFLPQYVMSAVQAAVEKTAAETASDWQVAIYHTPGVRPEDRSKAISSVQWRMTAKDAAQVWSDEETVNKIEEGFPEYDMKAMLKTSQRTRMSKSGKKYLIIPFRHNTPGNTAHAGAMPPDVYAQAKGLGKSSVTGKTKRLSATGASVPQNVYKWGGRLPAGLTPKLKPHHATDIHAGMVRFNTSTGKSKSSSYLTFRVMHEGQAGKWIRRAKPGEHLARKLADSAKSRLEQNIAEAIMSMQS